MRPWVLVTLGENSTAHVTAIVEAQEPDVRSALVQLRRLNTSSVSLRRTLEQAYRDLGGPRGLAVRLDDLEFVLVPLYHPSYGHVNKYEGDHQAIAVHLHPG